MGQDARVTEIEMKTAEKRIAKELVTFEEVQDYKYGQLIDFLMESGRIEEAMQYKWKRQIAVNNRSSVKQVFQYNKETQECTLKYDVKFQ